MDKIWIEDQGRASEADIPNIISQWIPDSAKGVAYYTDRFCASDEKNVEKLYKDTAQLLELRLFNDRTELRLYRSHMGEDFFWRLASEDTLKRALEKEGDPFLKDPKHRSIEYRQYLDMDLTYQAPVDTMGCLPVRSTGGGYYALPVAEGERMVKIQAYLQYDKKGYARIADYRLAGFCPEKSDV